MGISQFMLRECYIFHYHNDNTLTQPCIPQNTEMVQHNIQVCRRVKSGMLSYTYTLRARLHTKDMWLLDNVFGMCSDNDAFGVVVE